MIHPGCLFPLILLMAGTGPSAPPESAHTPVFLVGLFGAEGREATSFCGPPAATFEQTAWVFVPNDLGLAYVTLRLDFPSNIELAPRTVFHELVSQVIYTDYPLGTVEWNMVFNDCPSGWIRIFSQDITLLDDQPSRIGLLGQHSLARDCNFLLHGVTVSHELEVNEPGCEVVQESGLTWGALKSRFR